MIHCRNTILTLLKGYQSVHLNKNIILVSDVVIGRWVDTVVSFKVVCSLASDSVFLEGDRNVFVVLELVPIDGKFSVFSVVVSGFCINSVEVPDCGFEGELAVDGEPNVKIYEITKDGCE